MIGKFMLGGLLYVVVIMEIALIKFVFPREIRKEIQGPRDFTIDGLRGLCDFHCELKTLILKP
jgi:hypothetical protein